MSRVFTKNFSHHRHNIFISSIKSVTLLS
uniref:Uncharacterized protein n=1 Tax=Heterorhabditis bacteriophora TaxID=37862 RepID=A0A1I7X276_HETBA